MHFLLLFWPALHRAAPLVRTHPQNKAAPPPGQACSPTLECNRGDKDILKSQKLQILKFSKSTVWPQVSWLCTQQIEIYSLRLCHFTWDLSSMYDSSYIWSFRDDHCDGFHHTANLVLTMHSANAAGSRSRWVPFHYTDHNGSRLLWVCSVCAALGLQCLHNGFVQLSARAVSPRQSDCKEQGSANTQIQIQESKYKSTNTNWPLFNWRHQIIHNTFFLVLLLSSLQQVCNGQCFSTILDDH